MNRSLFIRYLLPFFQWYGLMIAVSIGLDFLLHKLNLVFVGRYLGYVGTFAILASLMYSLRKRKIISSGSPKNLLALHEYVSWSGSVLILVHAGIHFNALLPWLAVVSMLVVVASGLVGKFLLKSAGEALKTKRAQMMAEGIPKPEVDKTLLFDASTVDAMKNWRTVHYPITLLFALLSLLHIVTVFIFSK